MPIDGVLIGKHALRQGLADDRDALFATNVKLVEIAARNNGNAERGKKPGRDNTILRPRVLCASGVIVTIGAELQSGTGAGVAPGRDHPERSPVDTRKRINTTDDFLVKIDNLLICLPVKYGWNINGKD